ncbi:hypothetical protein FAZ19_22400 [Sphingobacterium alkalisoli]|uniref:Uncharacterized protein n=1 Tax=Sphingobacterium alkalisoli TaxID=1874115 RepID=A0A4U0GQL8_9SPHI|nr:hypothetical protein [Sphingobacterium alkalisoli]TJY60694.1 hypothetical protein FAZ19_22400 [Sphingobacterium alkalisoli]GGH31383.1 hypothetical protein GCM10011418_44120 [Sphingobacterium alkalisoli]
MKIFKILALILSVIMVFIVLFKGAGWIEEYLDEKVSYLKSEIPKEYLTVLDLDSSYIGHSETIFINEESIISSFEYQSKVNITAIKLNLSPSKPLYKAVDRYNDLTDLGIDGGVVYSGIDNQLIKFYYRPSYSSLKIESIGIHLPKSSLSKALIENDSTYAYFIENSYGFKIKFNRNQHSDISAEVKPSSIFEKPAGDKLSTNMLIVLKKQHDFMYLFLIHKMNSNIEEMTENEFASLVKKTLKYE